MISKEKLYFLSQETKTESIILKLLYIYTMVKQISKYIIDNECHISLCQKKKLPYGTGLQLNISV